MRVSREHASAGFTLAEVLLALTLLSVVGVASLGMLTQLTSNSINARDQVDHHATSVAVMESLLTRSYDDLTPSTFSGMSPEGLGWTVTITDEDTDLRRLTVEVDDAPADQALETLVANRF